MSACARGASGGVERAVGSGARDEALTQVFLRLTGGAGFREIEE